MRREAGRDPAGVRSLGCNDRVTFAFAHDLHHAREAVQTGGFESVPTWAIGLDGERPYVVSTPGRSIVVDFG